MFYFPAWSWDDFEWEQADKKLLKQASCAAAFILDGTRPITPDKTNGGT